jgi:hypothetical protein
MTKTYYPMGHTTEENLAVLCSDYPEFLAVSQLIKNKTERKAAWDPNTDGDLLLALMDYAYGVSKNSVVLTKYDEFNLAEIRNDKYYLGGSHKSMAAALLIVVLNYHLGIDWD